MATGGQGKRPSGCARPRKQLYDVPPLIMDLNMRHSKANAMRYAFISRLKNSNTAFIKNNKYHLALFFRFLFFVLGQLLVFI